MAGEEAIELLRQASSSSSNDDDDTEHSHLPHLTKLQARSLFFSHALSTWNARTYEFSAILFTAEAFPGTLLFSSIRGLSTTLTVLVFSSKVGQLIDTAETRWTPLVTSIGVNRAAIVAACLGWSCLLWPTWSQDLPQATRLLLFAVVVFIGSVEKLSGMANTLAMERDWIPAVADDAEASTGYSLTRLNAVMRRIDLSCKLIAPLVISGISEATSTATAVLVVGGMSLFGCALEFWSANWVWRTNARLRVAKRQTLDADVSRVPDERHSSRPFESCIEVLKAHLSQACDYFATDVWIPSFALSLLHFSALSYSATFITFLLNSGFSLLLVTVARAAGSIVEISSTFVAPVGIRRLGHSKLRDYTSAETTAFVQPERDSAHKHGIGLARTGLWGITMQCASLVPVVLAIFRIQPETDQPTTATSWATTIIPLFFFLSMSRLGLWVFDLTAQELTQVRVPSSHRSSFAGTEMAFVSLFEMCQWGSAAVFWKTTEFRWLALAGFGAVTVSAGMYASWVRTQRGHLVHWEVLGQSCACLKHGD